MPSPASAAEAVDTALQLIEVCVHCALRARGVYPAAAFEPRRAWGVTAWQARHPAVCAAVASALAAARPLLLRGTCEAVVLLLADAASAAPREQFVFALPAAAAAAGAAAPAPAAATYADLEGACAAAVQRLLLAAAGGGGVGAMPPPGSGGDTRWALLLRTHEVAEGSAAAAGEVFGGAGAEAWARVDAGDGEAALAARCRSVPVKSVRVGGFALDVSAEFSAEG